MKKHTASLNYILLSIVLFIAILAPRLVSIGQYSVADEGEWLERSANFYYALSTRDLARTYQTGHPGVLTMWAGAASFLLQYPEYRGIGPGYLESIEDIDQVLLDHGQDPLVLLNTGKLIMAIFTAVALVLVFWLLRHFFGMWISLSLVLLIAWDPYYMALSRLLHLDGLLASLVLLSVVSYVVYLHQRRWGALILSACTAGCAWLTKSPAVVLLPCIGLLALLDHWQHRASREWVRSLLLPLIIWGLIMVAVVFLLWPAMWVAPVDTLSQIYQGAAKFALRSNQTVFINGHIIQAADVGLWYYPLTFLWRTTPAVLFGLVLVLPALIWHFTPFDRHQVRHLMLAAALFTLLFYIMMQAGDKKFDRYFIPVYPFLDLIAGLGWVSAASVLMNRYKQRTVAVVLLLLVAITQLLLALQIYPYALSYYNPLLGGRSRAPQVMNVGWGEGYDLAASYLNTKPDASSLTAMASMGHGAFSFYFDGQAEWMDLSKIEQVDYVIIYIDHLQRCTPQVWCDVWGQVQPEKVIEIGGVPYAWIFDQHQLSPAVRAMLLAAGEN